MRLWKLLGLAGLAGVAATGTVLVRNERRRLAYTPEDVRARLHERLAAVGDAAPEEPDPRPAPRRRRGARLRDRTTSRAWRFPPRAR